MSLCVVLLLVLSVAQRHAVTSNQFSGGGSGGSELDCNLTPNAVSTHALSITQLVNVPNATTSLSSTIPLQSITPSITAVPTPYPSTTSAFLMQRTAGSSDIQSLSVTPTQSSMLSETFSTGNEASSTTVTSAANTNNSSQIIEPTSTFELTSSNVVTQTSVVGSSQSPGRVATVSSRPVSSHSDIVTSLSSTTLITSTTSIEVTTVSSAPIPSIPPSSTVAPVNSLISDTSSTILESRAATLQNTNSPTIERTSVTGVTFATIFTTEVTSITPSSSSSMMIKSPNLQVTTSAVISLALSSSPVVSTEGSTIFFSRPTPLPTTSSPPTATAPQNPFLKFFQNLSVPVIAGFIVGGVVVVCLSAIVCLLCCCCIGRYLRSKRKQRHFDIHNTGLTLSNPSLYPIGTTRPRGSVSSLRSTNPAHYELNQNGVDGFGIELSHFEGPSWETGVEGERLIGEGENNVTGGTSQRHRSQLSIPGDDIFQESTLPTLTPITYSSQILNTSSSLYQGLSVDEESVNRPRRLSLSGEYIQRIPGGSPSLRHQTRMGLSIQNEDEKSAQGSRVSISGSKNSGSRPSVFSSQISFGQSGSRSQMFSPVLSVDQMPSGTNKHREDDTLSLPLSMRTTSPLLQQSSLNSSFEVPTRDEPSGRTQAVATSHDLGAGVKDFASITSLPNHSFLSPELGTVRVPMELDPKPEPKLEGSSGRRSSLVKHDLGVLTTISDEKSKPQAKDTKEKESSKKEETSSPKKGRSKMSRLEMLTSLRASMRKAAKKVSFKSKSKQKDNIVIGNDSALSEQETTPTKDHPVRRHSDNSEPLASPNDMMQGRPRTYSDVQYLSQPNLHYPAVPHSPYHHANYQQLSQSYGLPYPPMQVPVDDQFSHGAACLSPDYSTYYPGMISPDYSDLTTPDHGHYGNQDHPNSPQHFVQQNESILDEYPQSTSPIGPHRAGSPSISYTSTEDHAPSPDHSMISNPYQSRSPTSHTAPRLLPTVHERYQFEELTSPEIFPPYSNVIFTSPSRQRGDPEFFMGGAGMYPPPAMGGYPGGMYNGYPMPPRENYFNDKRQNSLEHTQGLDQMVSSYGRQNSYDKTTNPYHPRQVSYEQPPGKAPHTLQNNNPAQHDSREYDQDPKEKRRSILSDSMNSELSASRTRVSWNTEVIEYVRTPSDGSDFDLNQL